MVGDPCLMSHEQKRAYYLRMLSHPWLRSPDNLPGFNEWYDQDTQLTLATCSLAFEGKTGRFRWSEDYELTTTCERCGGAHWRSDKYGTAGTFPKEHVTMNKKNETKPAAQVVESGLGNQSYLGSQQQSNYVAARPDYYQLSYLKRSDEGALWERHTEYFPTHDDSTTRALALSASGAVCVRTVPRYWMA